MRAVTSNRLVAERLSAHPRIDTVQIDLQMDWVRFDNGRSRSLYVGREDIPLYGLLELADNNPIVCADQVSIPSLAASLCLITLGPIVLSGLVLEPPSFITNLSCDEVAMSRALETAGWNAGLDVMNESAGATGVALATGIAEIASIPDPDEIRELYLERFGKSALIRFEAAPDWSPEWVVGLPICLLRVSVNADTPRSLVSVQAMCDYTGEFEAAQLITATNVMYGFEDDLGVRPRTR